MYGAHVPNLTTIFNPFYHMLKPGIYKVRLKFLKKNNFRNKKFTAELAEPWLRAGLSVQLQASNQFSLMSSWVKKRPYVSGVKPKSL